MRNELFSLTHLKTTGPRDKLKKVKGNDGLKKVE